MAVGSVFMPAPVELPNGYLRGARGRIQKLGRGFALIICHLRGPIKNIYGKFASFAGN
jgi:hypothetical protein